MLLGGLLDLGLPLRKLSQALRQLGLSPVRITARHIRREGVRATQVSIGQEAPSSSNFRNPGEWTRWARRSQLSDPMKRSFRRAVMTLAHAEGKGHGVPFSQIRFHQLARADTWVSLLGFCLGLAHFRIDTVCVSPIPLGSSHLDPQGRSKAVPGPATSWLLKRFTIDRRKERFEWTTPTGAALLASFASPIPAPPLRVRGIGHAVGALRPPRGSTVLRLILGEPIPG